MKTCIDLIDDILDSGNLSEAKPADAAAGNPRQ